MALPARCAKPRFTAFTAPSGRLGRPAMGRIDPLAKPSRNDRSFALTARSWGRSQRAGQGGKRPYKRRSGKDRSARRSGPSITSAEIRFAHFASRQRRWPTSNRNPGRLPIGIGGPASYWNAWPASSESATRLYSRRQRASQVMGRHRSATALTPQNPTTRKTFWTISRVH